MTVSELIDRLSELSAEDRDLPVTFAKSGGNYVEVNGVSLAAAARLGEPDIRFVHLWNSLDD